MCLCLDFGTDFGADFGTDLGPSNGCFAGQIWGCYGLF